MIKSETNLVTIKLTGTTGLVLHNNRCVNPRDPLKKEIAKISGRKQRTEADLDELARLEFIAGLYMGNGAGPVIPSQNLRKMMIEGARKYKLGKQFESGIFVLTDAPIEYDGPREAQGLWEDGRFAWQTVVKCGNKSSIVRTRPRFDKWAAEYQVEFEEDMVSRDDIINALKKAERGIGICDARSLGYGRFVSEVS